jgi:hypothetical protein
MSDAQENRGGAPVGNIADLDAIAAATVLYFRMWCDGADNQARVWADFAATLGVEQGRDALKSFEQLCKLCTQHGRRPLLRHSVSCKCVGADESCFANFIASAALGDREDAMLIATLIVRADIAPLITSLATDVGLALKRMTLRPADHMMTDTPLSNFQPTTLH